LALLAAAIPFLPSTRILGIDEILFSPLAIVPALAGIVVGVVAIRVGMRSRRKSGTRTRWESIASILGVGCGAIAMLVSAAAFWI
jgi:hypothetical protein